MLSIVTGNTGKYKEICKFLPNTLQTKQVALDIPEIQTNILADISYDKCLQAYVEVQGPVLVDDSGIYFDAYHQFPGALTKFLYTGIGLEGIAKLFTGESNKKATFQSVVSYMDSSLPEPVQFVGEIEGSLDFSYIHKQDADDHLPYDVIFVPQDMEKPAIFDMDLWQSEYNHRVRAVKQFGEWIEEKT